MSLSVFVCAGGKSSRFGNTTPKLFQDLGGRPVIHHVLDTACKLTPSENVYVISSREFLEWKGWPDKVQRVLQSPALGTGHAFQLALQSFLAHAPNASQDDTLLVLMGDCPLITAQDLTALLSDPAPITLLGMYPDVFRRYGQIQKDAHGHVCHIQECTGSTWTEAQAAALCYTGVLKIRADLAREWSELLPFHAATQEYYITDLPHIAYTQGYPVGLSLATYPAHFTGINTKEDWQAAYQILQHRWRQNALAQGALLHDPESTILAWDTRFAKDVQVHPFTFFGAGVTVEGGAIIHSFSHISHTHIGTQATVGPFAHIKAESHLGAHSCIGSFVEVKHSSIGDYSQAKHLAYLGDAQVGQDVNIGAGVVTCNYDGQKKHTTTIHSEAFVGAGTMLIAPVTLGARSTVGAGSVITEDVLENTLAISRAPQENRALSKESRHLKRRPKSTPKTSAPSA